MRLLFFALENFKRTASLSWKYGKYMTSARFRFCFRVPYVIFEDTCKLIIHKGFYKLFIAPISLHPFTSFEIIQFDWIYSDAL